MYCYRYKGFDMIHSMAATKPSSRADDTLTAALHRLYETHGGNLADYFRDVVPNIIEDQRAEPPSLVTERKVKER
jgi:hypothetical protein